MLVRLKFHRNITLTCDKRSFFRKDCKVQSHLPNMPGSTDKLFDQILTKYVNEAKLRNKLEAKCGRGNYVIDV